MIFPKHSIDSLLSLRFPPFIIEVTILIVTVSAGFYSENYNMKIALVTLVVIYAFMNYIFEKLTVPFDYSQKDYYEYDNIPWYWKILLHDKKYSYRIDDDGGSIMNDLKLVYQKEASVIFNEILDGLTYSQAANRKLVKKTKQVIILISICDVENVYIKRVCFAIYFLGITRTNFTMSSFEDIVEHIDSRQSQNKETVHAIELICLNCIQRKLCLNLENDFKGMQICDGLDYYREIKKQIEDIIKVVNDEQIFEIKDDILRLSGKNKHLQLLLKSLPENIEKVDEIFVSIKKVFNDKESSHMNNEKFVDIYKNLELDYEWTGQISNCWEPTIAKRINNNSVTIRID